MSSHAMPADVQFSREKLRAAILYACAACPPEQLGAVKLHKVLYFADMIQFVVAGSPVTGATYRKRPFGPTCQQLLPMLRDMARDGDLEIADVEYFGRRKKEYTALASPPAGLLSPAEAALLDEVVEFVCQRHSARSISDYSHQAPWELAEYGDVIPYSSAIRLFPADISPEAFEAVERGATEVEEARRSQGAVVMPLLNTLRGRVRAAV